MGHRILVLLIGACVSFAATNVSALGLGEITLKSALNQPLQAEVELLDIRDLSEEEIIVELADEKAFERIGVDRTFFLTGLKFKVEIGDREKPVIVITTRKPVREPFLNFVIQTFWPTGKLLREYTVLMDLPVFSETEAAPVAAAGSRYAQPTDSRPSVEPEPQISSSSVANPRSSYGSQRSSGTSSSSYSEPSYAGQDYSGPSYDGETYRVERNDTLWEIAQQVRPTNSVSVHQTMIALQDANPEAFINNNINLLKSGQVLRIPSADEIRANSQRQAVQEVAVQNAQWSGSSFDVSDGPQLEGSRSYSNDVDTQTEIEGRVTLSSPDDTFGSAEGRASGGAADFSSDALENELSITMEELEKAKGENSDLRSTVTALEDQIDTMEGMLEVANENLRKLQIAASQNDSAQTETESFTETPAETEFGASGDDIGNEFEDPTFSDGTDVDDLYTSETTDDFANEFGDSAELTSDVDDSSLLAEEARVEETQDLAVEEVEPTPTPAPKVSKVVRSAPKEPSIIDLLMENIIIIGAGLIAILAGIFFLIKRKGDDEEEFDDFLQTMDEEIDEVSDSDDVSIDDIADIESDMDDVLQEESQFDEPAVVEESQEQETEDPVAEADIYIAYGKYDQAEEMLLSAHNREPQDEAVLLKLLEVYSLQDNVDAFDNHYRHLRSFGSSDAVGRADKLRSAIADAPAFDDETFEDSAQFEETQEDGSGTGGSDDLDSLGDDLDLSLDLEAPADTSESAESPASDNFDLELDLEDTASEDFNFEEELSLDLDDTESTSESDESASEAIDFALDLDGADSEETSDELSLDIEDDASGDSDNIEFDLGDLDLDSESTSEEVSLDLDESLELNTGTDANSDSEEDIISYDFGDADAKDEPAVELDDIDTLDLEEELTASFEGGDEELSLDLGESSDDSLESDLASLDEELSLSLDENQVNDSVDADEALDLGGLELDSDEPSESAADVELDLGLDSAENTSAPDEGLSLSDLVEEDNTPAELDEIDDFGSDADLSVLDDELEEMASDLGGLEDDLESGLGDTSEMEAVLELDSAPEDEEDTVIREAPDAVEEPSAELEPSAESEPSAEPEPSAELELSTETEQDSTSDFEEFEESDSRSDAASESPEFVPGNTQEFEFDIPEIDPEGDDDDSDLDFLSDSDETATKLDLARAYIDMGDANGAKEIIREVLKEGNDQQKSEAEALLGRIDS